MTYIIPDKVKQEWKDQAQAAGMAYSTVVNQHVYDLQGLLDVLNQQLAQASDALKTLPANSTDYTQASHKVASLKAKCDQTSQQLAAYQAEQKKAEAETSSPG